MDRSVPVKDAMTVNVITVERDEPATRAAEIMVEEDIGSVVVMENDEPIGIICERDLLEKVISSDLKPSEVTVERIMESPLITTTPEKDMLDAMRTMVKNNIGHLPVVDDFGSLIGIVTVQDVLEVTPQILEVLPERENLEQKTEEEIEESVCEICGEAHKSLVRYKDKWICDECRDFLVG
ncbi:MAG: cyclic nucleotide-binding/CBS domain-containing protein [Candidatus Hadarchaeota archaeon]